MVRGIESFAEKFKDYSDCYTVIGGAACVEIRGCAGMKKPAAPAAGMGQAF